MDYTWNDLYCFRITLLGNTATGKTAIANRLVNNYFPVIYEPTTKLEKYTFIFDISEIQTKKKLCMVILEDLFGLNNALLQTNNDLIRSNEQKDKKLKMTADFKNIMFTSLIQKELNKNINLNEDEKKMTESSYLKKVFFPEAENKSFQRKGFVFVVDASDQNSIEDVSEILDKLNQIEKTNNMDYPKLILINKKDKVDQNEIKNIKKQFEDKFKKNKCKIDVRGVSALTNEGVVESFKNYLASLQQIEVESMQNKGFEENDQDINNNIDVFIFFN